MGRSGQGRGEQLQVEWRSGPLAMGVVLLVQYLALGDEARGTLPPGV